MDKDLILRELHFQATRSGGPGGQHVNKVASKIQLSFRVDTSAGLSEKEKLRLLKKLGNKLTKENVLLLYCEESKSQHRNKELVIKRFFKLIAEMLQAPKKRKQTKPSKASVEKRLQSKRKEGQKKANRRKPDGF